MNDFNPRTAYSYFQDFASYVTEGSPANIDGTLEGYASSSTAVYSVPPEDSSHVGILGFYVATPDSGDFAGVVTGSPFGGFVANTNVIQMILGGGRTSFETLLRPSILSNTDHEYALVVGFYSHILDSLPPTITDGAFFLYDHGNSYTNVGSPQNWRLVVDSGSTWVVVDSGVPVVSNFTRLEIDIHEAAQSAKFKINDALVGSIPMTPCAVGFGAGVKIGSGAWNLSDVPIVGIDYMKVEKKIKDKR